MNTILKILSCALLLVLRVASAHEPFEITSNARLFSDRITLNVLITDSTAAKLCLPGATITSKLHEAELRANRVGVERCAAALYVVTDGAAELAPSKVEVRLTEEQDLDVMLTYPPSTQTHLSFEAVHLKRLDDPTYGATFTATSEKAFLAQKLLRADDPVLTVEPGSSAEPQQSGFFAFLELGIEHILTGYDHLLFLAGLLVVCRGVRSALIIITSFTLAHSVTLALAGLGIVTLSSTIVEPLIAASIVFVGLENLWRWHADREPPRRWLLTLCFGLIHGFGFASALQEAGLPRGFEIVKPLLAFNLGVETGQLAVAAIFLPLVFVLRRYAWFAKRGVLFVSLLVATAGLFWLIERVFGV